MPSFFQYLNYYIAPPNCREDKNNAVYSIANKLNTFDNLVYNIVQKYLAAGPTEILQNVSYPEYMVLQDYQPLSFTELPLTAGETIYYIDDGINDWAKVMNSYGNIGYVPKEKVLGLSKFARVAELLAKRPVLQEQYTSDLVKIIQEKLDPQGVAVYVKGRHSCMEIRGIKRKSLITTSALTGCFKSEAECRKEFYDVCRTGDE